MSGIGDDPQPVGTADEESRDGVELTGHGGVEGEDGAGVMGVATGESAQIHIEGVLDVQSIADGGVEMEGRDPGPVGRLDGRAEGLVEDRQRAAGESLVERAQRIDGGGWPARMPPPSVPARTVKLTVTGEPAGRVGDVTTPMSLKVRSACSGRRIAQ